MEPWNKKRLASEEGWISTNLNMYSLYVLSNTTLEDPSTKLKVAELLAVKVLICVNAPLATDISPASIIVVPLDITAFNYPLFHKV